MICGECGEVKPEFERHFCRVRPKGLRDEFAMAAIVGIITSPKGWLTLKEQSGAAYEIADAMLKAREAK